jgi:putative ABC transport system permease protein
VEIGLVYAFVGMGVFLAFRVLDFPDLTVDGSFPLGAGVVAVAIVAGINPWIGMVLAMAAGAVAGLVTAVLNQRFKILHLLASILTMIALFSINLRVMGGPNLSLLGETTALTPFLGHGMPSYLVKPLFLAVLVLIVALLMARFLSSDFGLAMRATGANPRMARAQGVRTELQVYVGMALSNALVGLAGALFAQTNGFADVTIGTGTIVVGLAAVIIGETLLRFGGMLVALIGCVIGAILYRLAIQAALSADLSWIKASDINLIAAVLVALALILPRLRGAR